MSRRQLVAGACMVLVSLGARAAASDDAVAVVAGLHAALVEVASVQPPLSLEQRYERLAPVITGAHDLTYMGRITVRHFWRDWSEAQRATFIDAFTRLSITTYASRFATIAPDAFEILGSEPEGDDRMHVMALIHRKNDTDVPMDYLLQSEDGRWRIINVFAEGTSDLSVRASEYYEILESRGFDGLIDKLTAETNAF